MKKLISTLVLIFFISNPLNANSIFENTTEPAIELSLDTNTVMTTQAVTGEDSCIELSFDVLRELLYSGVPGWIAEAIAFDFYLACSFVVIDLFFI